MSCKLITSHSLNKSIWCLSASLFTHKVLPLSCWRDSFCEQCYVKELPLGTEMLAVVCAYCGSGNPKDHDTTGKICWVWAQCSPPASTAAGSDGGLQSLPSSPLQSSSIYREWHWMTLHLRQHTEPHTTHIYTDTNMLLCSGRRLDGAISELLLRDLWPIGNNKDGEKEGETCWV